MQSSRAHAAKLASVKCRDIPEHGKVAADAMAYLQVSLHAALYLGQSIAAQGCRVVICIFTPGQPTQADSSLSEPSRVTQHAGTNLPLARCSDCCVPVRSMALLQAI